MGRPAAVVLYVLVLVAVVVGVDVLFRHETTAGEAPPPSYREVPAWRAIVALSHTLVAAR